MISINNKLCFALLLAILSCKRPSIEIPDDLKTGLGDRYYSYVEDINNASSGDSISVVNILMYDNLYDGAAYEHGWVMIELMRKIGDDMFSNSVMAMDSSHVDNIREFFIGGLDIHTKGNSLLTSYPKTRKALNLN